MYPGQDTIPQFLFIYYNLMAKQEDHIVVALSVVCLFVCFAVIVKGKEVPGQARIQFHSSYLFITI